MKKAFTLVELIVAIAITSIILLVVTSVTVFSSKILAKQKYESQLFDEIVLVDNVLKKYIDESSIIEVKGNLITNDQDKTIEFNEDSNAVLVNYQHYLQLERIDDVIIEKEAFLLKLLLLVDESTYSFSYYI